MVRVTDIITILGWYGSGNAGDESILLAIFRLLKNNYKKNYELVVISHRPKYIRKKYGCKSIDVNDFRTIIITLLKSQLFIFGGGGLVKPNSINYYSKILLLANCLASKTMVYSVGVIPVSNLIDRILVVISFTFCDFISVRDDFSRNVLQNLGIKKEIIITRDPVFSFNVQQNSKYNLCTEMKPYVTICLKHWYHNDLVHYNIHASQSYDYFILSLSRVLKYITHLGYNLVFLPLMVSIPENDDIDHKNLYNKIGECDNLKLISSQLDPDEIINIIAQSEMVIGMRYHSIIYSLISGVPVIGLAYAQKVRNLMSDVNLDQFCIDLKGEFCRELLSIVDYTFEKKDEIKNKIKSQVKKQHKILNTHDDLMWLMINQPSLKRTIKKCLMGSR